MRQLQKDLNRKLPKAVQGLLLAHNGGIRLYDFITLSNDVC